ncbi:MAG: hypothetical protein Q8S44_01700 [Flavobacteriaceae bacterium]|nr:hypothetical protein [Flavobacteriaceae bacterium]
MLEIILIFVFVIFLGVLLALTDDGKKFNGQKNIDLGINKRNTENIEGFSYTIRHITSQGLIAIDDNSEQIIIKKGVSGKILKYSYSDILSCEIIEDGVTTSVKSTKRILGGALIGGVLAGGAGLIVGGLSGQQLQEKEIKSLDLKIVFLDTSNPNFTLRFFDAYLDSNKLRRSIKLSDTTFQHVLNKSIENLKKWKDVIEIIIEKNDRKEVKTTEKNEKNLNLHEEILTLNKMKNEGIISQIEFEKLKAKIIE